MKLYIFYTANTPADTEIEYLNRRLTEASIVAEMVDADSREGTSLAELYDVMQRPSVVATRDDGQLLHKWQGGVPRLEDIMLYSTTAT